MSYCNNYLIIKQDGTTETIIASCIAIAIDQSRL